MLPHDLGGALTRITHRSHEHRALHGVSRAWHAAWYAVVVAGGVAVRLSPLTMQGGEIIRHCPLKPLRNLLPSQTYPPFNPTKSKDGKERKSRKSFCFSFLFSKSGPVHTAPPLMGAGDDRRSR